MCLCMCHGTCRVRKGAGSQSIVSCNNNLSGKKQQQAIYRGLSEAAQACVFTSGALVYHPCLSVCFGMG